MELVYGNSSPTSGSEVAGVLHLDLLTGETSHMVMKIWLLVGLDQDIKEASPMRSNNLAWSCCFYDYC